MPDETTGYRLGHPCKNHSRLETVLSSRRSIWVRKLSLRDSSLLRFAKRRPSPTSSKTANEQNSPAESIPSTAPSGPSGSPLASALVTPPGDDTSLGSSHNNTKVSPSQTPAAGECPLDSVIPFKLEPGVLYRLSLNRNFYIVSCFWLGLPVHLVTVSVFRRITLSFSSGRFLEFRNLESIIEPVSR